MRINFIFSFYPRFPIGGFKVLYEYANQLSARGHQVTVIHSRHIEPVAKFTEQIKDYIWTWMKPVIDGGTVPWFNFHPHIRLLLLPNLQESFIPDADISIATCWSVVETIKQYSQSKGQKSYIVYDYEIWRTETDAIRQKMQAAFQSGLFAIATSPSVEQMLAENNVSPVAYIPCGIDLQQYRIDLPITNRVWGTIGFPARQATEKGTADAITAIQILKHTYGDALKFKAFGPKPIDNLPTDIDFQLLPTDTQLKEFYNSISIFIFPSHYEGWGLPGHEAIACGAALVASDSVGLRNYAIDGETALLVPIKRPDLLAQAIDNLLQDDQLRQKIASQGHQHIQRYTWKRAVDSLEKLLSEL